jgi:pSer/pThr/pTyr-binding forkhead associated (FHA) protein
MNLSHIFEKLGRTIFEEPFKVGGEHQPPEVAEIRFALLDEIRKKSYRSGGKRVFPYNFVRIHVRGVEDSRSGVFKADFFKRYFEQEIRRSLVKAECKYPEDLEVEVNVTSQFPAKDDPWLSIETEAQKRRPRLPVRRAARLTVLEGKANRAEISLDKLRTNLGRTVNVYRSEGLSRRNDLAFTEETEINRTVSREHAHVQYDETTGEYRIYNDRWYKRNEKGEGSCGLWIVRNGLSQEVHRNERGTRLHSGDEIHLGKAIVRFLLKG